MHRPLLKILRNIGVCAVAALGLGAMAAETFTLNGRPVQLESTGSELRQSRSAQPSPAASAQVRVRDVASGKVSVYAEGLIITLRQPASLKALLREHPALTLQYAPGAYAFVRVPRNELAATMNALATDPRVAAVHLRPLPVKANPR